MSPFEIIIASIGGSAALFGIIGWLTKSLISQLLSKDIENHKSKLQYDSEIELTKFKKEIEKTEFEHQKGVENGGLFFYKNICLNNKKQNKGDRQRMLFHIR